MTTKLTQGAVNKVAEDYAKGSQIYDDEVSGLRIVVGSKSSSYKLVGRINDGSDRYISIIVGRTDELSLRTARERSVELKLALRRGEDPRRPKGTIPTLRTAWDRYKETRGGELQESTVVWYEGKVFGPLKPLLDIPFDKLERDVTRSQHEKITMSKDNPHSNDYFQKVAAKFMNMDEMRGALQRTRGLHGQLKALIDKSEGQIKALADEIEANHSYLHPAEKLTIKTRAVAAKRAGSVDLTEAERVSLLQKIDAEDRAVSAAELHYGSPVQILMRSTIGMDRRSTFTAQIADAGNTELLSLAHLAAATGNRELGAALVGRVSAMPASKRPFNEKSLATSLVGETFAEAELIFGSVRELLVDALAINKAFESGKIGTVGKVRSALIKRDNADKRNRLAVARGAEPDPVERMKVELDRDKPTSYRAHLRRHGTP